MEAHTELTKANEFSDLSICSKMTKMSISSELGDKHGIFKCERYLFWELVVEKKWKSLYLVCWAFILRHIVYKMLWTKYCDGINSEIYISHRNLENQWGFGSRRDGSKWFVECKSISESWDGKFSPEMLGDWGILTRSFCLRHQWNGQMWRVKGEGWNTQNVLLVKVVH